MTCGSGKYQTATTDAWKNTAGTAANFATNCCTAKATCASTYTCPAGMKKKTSNDATKCTSNAASCAVGSTCCEADNTKCGGVPAANMTCGSGKYQTATTDAWKNTAGTAANFATNCCTAKATCASTAYSCPAGMKKKASVDSTKCTSNAASCASTTCCEKDTLKCGGYANADITCATGKFRSCYYGQSSGLALWRDCMNKATTASTKATDCCESKPTCSDFAAYMAKKKATVSGSEQVCPGLAIILAVWVFLTGAQ